MSTLRVDNLNTLSGNGIAADIASVSGGQLSNRNKVHNGAMNLCQRFSTNAHTPSNTNRVYTLDRWAYWSNQASKTTIQQVEDAPVGFRFSSKCTVASAYSINSGDWFGYMTHIEGFDLYDFELGNSNAQTMTLSFYVKSSVAGTWAGSVRAKGSSPNYCYPYNYTINSVNTWEKKTITVPGPTSGTWNSGNGEGMCLWFDLGSGSDYHATANNWHGTNITGPSSSPFIANAGATWQITGVQLEKGSIPTEYEHRSFADEFARCQRYYEHSYVYGTVPGTADNSGSVMFLTNRNTGTAHTMLRYMVRKRTSPTLVAYSPTQTDTTGMRDLDNSTTYNYTMNRNGQTGCTAYPTGNLGLGYFIQFHYTAESEFK